MERVHLDNKGFTLLEFLVAIVIIAVGLLALLQSVNLSIAHNLTNIFRNQAVMLADERMTLEKTKPFDCISTTTSSTNISLTVKNANTFKNYSVVKIGSSITNNTTNVEIDVIWKYKGTRYIHTISSLVSR
jgi:type IV pilus assembly protein PilV